MTPGASRLPSSSLQQADAQKGACHVWRSFPGSAAQTPVFQGTCSPQRSHAREDYRWASAMTLGSKEITGLRRPLQDGCLYTECKVAPAVTTFLS